MKLNKKILYSKYIIYWLNEKKNYVKESTYGNYSVIVYNYVIPYLGSYYIHELNNKIIQNYILNLHKSNKSNKTIKDIISIVKSSLKKAFNNLNIKSFDLSFYYPIDNKNKKMYILNKKEQNKIVRYSLKNINNKSIGILLALFTGIRIGELCALKWNDFDFKKGTITIGNTLQRITIKNENKIISKIIITTPKTTNSIRVIPINSNLIEILKTIKSNKENYILTNNNYYIEPRCYRSYFNSILKKLKINHFAFHSLRHTFATNCIELKIDYKTISELLGHSTVNITLNLYVHPMIDYKRKCMNNLYKTFTKKL